MDLKLQTLNAVLFFPKLSLLGGTSSIPKTFASGGSAFIRAPDTAWRDKTHDFGEPQLRLYEAKSDPTR